MERDLWCVWSWEKEAVRNEEQLEVDAPKNGQKTLGGMAREERESDKNVWSDEISPTNENKWRSWMEASPGKSGGGENRE